MWPGLKSAICGGKIIELDEFLNQLLVKSVNLNIIFTDFVYKLYKLIYSEKCILYIFYWRNYTKTIARLRLSDYGESPIISEPEANNC